MICKAKPNSNKTWCGRNSRINPSSKQWSDVTCEKCLKFKNAYSRMKSGEILKKKEVKEFKPDIMKLRKYFEGWD